MSLKVKIDTPRDVLIRMVKARVEQDSQAATVNISVSFSKLISLATRREKFLLVTGWFFASLTGCMLPSFIWFIGDVFDTFSPDFDRVEARDKIRTIFFIMIGLCVLIVITSTLQSATLSAAST